MKWTSILITFSAMAGAVMAEPTTYTFSVTSGTIEFQELTSSPRTMTASSPVGGTFAVTVHHDLGMSFGDSTLFELDDANLFNTSTMCIRNMMGGLCTATVSPGATRFLDFNSSTGCVLMNNTGTVTADDYTEATVVLSGPFLNTTVQNTAWSAPTLWTVKLPSVPVVPLTLQTNTPGGTVQIETVWAAPGAAAQLTGTHHWEFPATQLDPGLEGITMHWDWVITAEGTVSHPLYYCDSTLRLTATPEPGYEFVQWYVEESYGEPHYSFVSSENPLLMSISFPTIVEASFAPAGRTLTLVADPNNGGTIEASPPPDGNGRYATGSVVTLTAHPAAGYAFADWSGDATGPNNPITITMDGNKSVTAGFALVPHSLTLTVSSHPEWGEVIVEPNLPVYPHGTNVTLSAVLIEPGKMWMGWSGDVDPNKRYTNPLTLVMDSDKVITTEFKCAMGVGQMLPALLCVLMLSVLTRRK